MCGRGPTIDMSPLIMFVERRLPQETPYRGYARVGIVGLACVGLLVDVHRAEFEKLEFRPLVAGAFLPEKYASGR